MIFSPEGKFYKVGSILVDIIMTSFLFIIFSVGIITIGATTTGLYYAITKRVSGKDGYLIRDFLKSFTENFLRATIIFVILALAILLLIWNIWLGNMMEVNLIVTIIQFFALMQLIFIYMYSFVILARFEMKVLSTIKMSFIIANKNLLITLTNLGFLIAIVLSTVWLSIIIIFIMGIYIYFSSMFFVKIFRKMDPDFDKIVEEELKPLNFDKL